MEEFLLRHQKHRPKHDNHLPLLRLYLGHAEAAPLYGKDYPCIKCHLKGGTFNSSMESSSATTFYDGNRFSTGRSLSAWHAVHVLAEDTKIWVSLAEARLACTTKFRRENLNLKSILQRRLSDSPYIYLKSLQGIRDTFKLAIRSLVRLAYVIGLNEHFLGQPSISPDRILRGVAACKLFRQLLWCV